MFDRSPEGRAETRPGRYLVDLAEQQMRDGMLASQLPTRVSVGPGRAEHCTLCTHALTLGDLGYRVMESAEVDRSAPIFHDVCFVAWREAVAQSRSGVFVGKTARSAAGQQGY